MFRRNRPLPPKVPLSLGPSLTGVCVYAAVFVIFALLSLLYIKSGPTWETLAWALLATLSAIALVDAVQKRRTIMLGGEVLVAAPPDVDSVDAVHTRRAFVTMGFVNLLLLNMAGVCFVLSWRHLHGLHNLPLSAKHIFMGVLAVGFTTTFGIYCYAASKRLLLWSRLLQAQAGDTNAQSFSLPPLTRRGLTQPTITIVFLWTWISMGIASNHCFSGGHLHTGILLLGILAGLAVGALTGLLYVGLVAALWAWSNHVICLTRREADIPAGHVWPPPVSAPREQEKEDAVG